MWSVSRWPTRASEKRSGVPVRGQCCVSPSGRTGAGVRLAASLSPPPGDCQLLPRGGRMESAASTPLGTSSSPRNKAHLLGSPTPAWSRSSASAKLRRSWPASPTTNTTTPAPVSARRSSAPGTSSRWWRLIKGRREQTTKKRRPRCSGSAALDLDERLSWGTATVVLSPFAEMVKVLLKGTAHNGVGVGVDTSRLAPAGSTKNSVLFSQPLSCPRAVSREQLRHDQSSLARCATLTWSPGLDGSRSLLGRAHSRLSHDPAG